MKSPDWSGLLELDDGTVLPVQALSTNDLDDIEAIEQASHAYPWKRSHFVDSLRTAHHHCFGVKQSDSWVGHAVVSCIAGEAELLLLVVDRRWQGRGIGRRLLAHLVAAVGQQADTLFLEVGATNRRAIALYEGLDFNQVGMRPNYYGVGAKREDALIFARSLD